MLTSWVKNMCRTNLGQITKSSFFWLIEPYLYCWISVWPMKFCFRLLKHKIRVDMILVWKLLTAPCCNLILTEVKNNEIQNVLNLVLYHPILCYRILTYKDLLDNSVPNSRADVNYQPSRQVSILACHYFSLCRKWLVLSSSLTLKSTLYINFITLSE